MNDADILPRFKGIAIHDFWKPYFKFSCAHALCNAHHLRELIFLFEHEKQKWAKDMIDLLLKIKQTVEKTRTSGTKYLARSKIEQFEKHYQKIINQGLEVNPDMEPKMRKKKKSKAQNLLFRFKEHRDKVLAFMYDFQVPFDNNLAERDIRMLKVQQKISGCFRSDLGAEMFCRIRSYISTVNKQRYHILYALQIALRNVNIFHLERASE
jgi:transposase